MIARPRLILPLLAGVLLGPLYSRLVAYQLKRNLAHLRAGDPEPLLRFYADDVRFRFPGDSSWAGEFHGKDEARRWLRDFVHSGLQIYADEIVVSGPPWNTTICLLIHDHATDANGEIVYRNRAVIWGHMAWGTIREYETHEDTQKVAAFDELAKRGERAGMQPVA